MHMDFRFHRISQKGSQSVNSLVTLINLICIRQRVTERNALNAGKIPKGVRRKQAPVVLFSTDAGMHVETKPVGHMDAEVWLELL